MDFIDLKTQYHRIGKSVADRTQAVYAHAQFIMGPEIAELEQTLAARTGSTACISCSSGTDALLIALMALEVKAGDEVIVPAFTFIATAETIALLGATPVFVDIDSDTYNLDTSVLEAAITPRTRAVMPVSMFGQCADIDAINEIAARHRLAVIEDAAQSFGATYKGRASCDLTTIGCTSFFPSKPLGCYGDGGACFTNDPDLATAMREIRNHGQSGRYQHTRLGLNGRLDTLQAAILLAKLEIFDDELARRTEIANRYTRLLGEHVKTPILRPDLSSVFAQYTIEVEDRERVVRGLQTAGIPTAIHYPTPLHLQPVFRSPSLPPGSFPQSERASVRVLSLPMHPYLGEADQDRIAGAVIHEVTVTTQPVQ